MRRLLTWLLPYIARIYAHYGLALGELDHERLRAELIADVRAQLHDAMAAVNGGLPDRGVSTIATNRPNGGIPGATPNAPAPGAGPGTPTDKVVTTNAAGAHDSTVRTHARIGLAPGAHVLAFVLISLFAVALHAAPEPDPLNVIRHAFALPQGGAANSNGRFDSNGNLYVNVAAGGASGGTSSTFGAAFPGTGTAAGWYLGGNMTYALVDASHYAYVDCVVGCSGGATTPTDAFANPSTAGLQFDLLAGFNGTTWDRLQVDGSKFLKTTISAALPAGTNVIGHVIVDTAPTTAVTGTFWQATQPVSGTFWQATQPVSGTFWQATQPVSLASAQVASGAYASGSISDGADVTLGAKADAKSAATDTTAITVMQVLKEISSLEQAPASRAVTNAGTFGVQATIADAADTTLGAKADAKSTATDTTAVTIMQVLKEISAQEQAPASRAVTNAGTFAVQATVQNDPCLAATPSAAPFSLASTTALKVITKATGKTDYICSINVGPINAAATSLALIAGTKTTNDCDTSTAGLAGGTTAATGWLFPASGGLTFGNGTGVVAATASTGLDVCLLAGGTGQISGVLTYVQQ